MKRQIRQCCFETNSSSMHSLVIKKENSYYDESEIRDGIYINREGEWDIWGDDLMFGRTPFQCLGTFDGKVRYAIASLCSYRDNADEVFNDIAKIVYELIPECTSIKLPTHYDDSKIYYGCVDEDILTEFIENEKIDLKEFLTNKKYVVIVDGDEYCIYKNMKKSGLINTDRIEREFTPGDWMEGNNEEAN